MLHANRLKLTEGKLATIAGGSAGNKVLCSNQALPVFNDLVGLANKGNHWAGMIVRGIKGLTSGRLHKKNVYVEQENNMAYGRGLFYLVLPGATATMESNDDGSYVLKHLTADTNYVQMQENQQKPGLWRVSAREDDVPQFQKDGTVLKKEYRPVLVAGVSEKSPSNIVDATRDDLKNVDTTIKSMVDSAGFDLHRTPGDGHIVGLKPAHRALATSKDKEIVESATLLANTMFKARNIEGVLWYSDKGGSGVLTRALQILERENKNKAKFNQHRIFLNHPTTSSTEAIKLAKNLELGLAGNGGKKVGFHPNEIRGNHLRSAPTLKGTLTAGGFALSGAGATFGLIGAAPSAAGAIGLVGAMVFVGATINSGFQAFKRKKY